MSEPVTVILVDDHQMVRQGIRAFLGTQPDLEVVGEAASGEEGVTLAASLRPDVALVDLVMAEMPGIEAIRRIRRESPRTRVLVLTSFDDESMVVPALREGATSYLLKDVGADALADAVRRTAVGEAVLHPRAGRRVVEGLHAGADRADALARLTDREAEVLRLIAEGPRQRGDRRAAHAQREDRQGPRERRAVEAASRRPDPGGGLRLALRAHGALRPVIVKEHIVIPLEPPRSFDSPLHSQGVLVTAPGRLAFVSGQVGVRPDATIGAGVEEQTRIAFDNVDRVLAEASLGLGDVASLRTYLTSADHIPAFTRAAEECLAGHRPASTLLLLDRLANPALLVQVEAVAVAG